MVLRERLASKSLEPGVVDQKRIDDYVKKHLPERFREPSLFGVMHQKVSKAIFQILNTLGMFRIKGREHVPEAGGFVMVSNHTRFFDESKLFAFLDRSAHIIAADMHFDANPLQRWFMEKIGAIEVKSTLNHLSIAEKEELLTRVPKGAQEYYRKVIARDAELTNAKSLGTQREMLRSTVAVLIKREPVILFPEGLWLYEPGHVMRKAYAGIEMVAREYRRVTGKDLPIVPVGITSGQATAGKSVVLEAGQTVHDIMRNVAALLPEAERGYYEDNRS